ncbi:MAG: NUDIX domain-containing protein [Candidatus Moranbacteria bacterium]|nr:NUDIX domain-containing protein [Candidatus Moranbacteria bacterium]
MWVTDSKGNILLAQRSFSKKHSPGKWGPAVAGTNDEGETYDSNIEKEAMEELGIVDVPFERRDKIRRQGKYEYFLQWYAAVIDLPAGAFHLQEDEVERVEWYSPAELRTAFEEHPDAFLSGMELYVRMFLRDQES